MNKSVLTVIRLKPIDLFIKTATSKGKQYERLKTHVQNDH